MNATLLGPRVTCEQLIRVHARISLGFHEPKETGISCVAAGRKSEQRPRHVQLNSASGMLFVPGNFTRMFGDNIANDLITECEVQRMYVEGILRRD